MPPQTEQSTEKKSFPEVWILTSQIPLEPSPGQKPSIHYHCELGWHDSEHAAEKGAKNRTLKPVQVKKAE